MESDGFSLNTNTFIYIVYDQDTDFGDIAYVNTSPSISDVQSPISRIWDTCLQHISETQRNELLSLLDEFADLFSDKSGLCTWYEHEINVKNGFRAKRLNE